jgi:hypothetical protein
MILDERNLIRSRADSVGRVAVAVAFAGGRAPDKVETWDKPAHLSFSFAHALFPQMLWRYDERLHWGDFVEKVGRNYSVEILRPD